MQGGRRTSFAYFGGGCFWCTEAVFKMLRGVVSAAPGYAGGSAADPTYEEVSTGETGHAEVTRVEFDPSLIGYDDLLTVFFATHDPTSLNRQGTDVGTQYRSIILYGGKDQKWSAEEYIRNLEAKSPGGKPIVTEIRQLDKFYPAEDYHKDYYEHHRTAPYCLLMIDPKLEKVRKKFAKLLKDKSR